MGFSLLRKKADTFDYNIQRECKNCNHSFEGRFCSRCGEKVITQEERTVRSVLSHVVNAFTFLDGKFWKSMSSMVLHPGRMSMDISEGKRTPYMRLVSLFFVGNLIYFLVPIFETFNSSLYSQMDFMSYSRLLGIRELVENRILQENITMEQFAADYKILSTTFSKTCLILWAGILALLCSTIHYSKMKMFFDHVNFTLEFANYVLMGLTVTIGLILYLPFLIMGINLISDEVLIYIYIPLLFYFLFRAIKLFYGGRNWMIALKSVLTLLALIVSVELYRLFLFSLTFYKL